MHKTWRSWRQDLSEFFKSQYGTWGNGTNNQGSSYTPKSQRFPPPGPKRKLIFRAHCFRCLKIRREIKSQQNQHEVIQRGDLVFTYGLKLPLQKRVGSNSRQPRHQLLRFWLDPSEGNFLKNHWRFGGGSAAIVFVPKVWPPFWQPGIQKKHARSGNNMWLEAVKVQRCEVWIAVGWKKYPCAWLKVVDSTLKVVDSTLKMALEFHFGWDFQEFYSRRGTVKTFPPSWLLWEKPR